MTSGTQKLLAWWFGIRGFGLLSSFAIRYSDFSNSLVTGAAAKFLFGFPLNWI